MSLLAFEASAASGGKWGENSINSNQQGDEEYTLDDQVRDALHAELDLTDDQVVDGLEAYNTWHSDRNGRRLSGGELVVRLVLAGKGIDGGTATRKIEIDDNNRGGLSEETITLLGAKAMERDKVERIIL